MESQSHRFAARCYNLLRKVPRGRVTTYAALAGALHSKAYRAVGNAMHRNENAPVIPCHRVVRSDGTLGGYAGGVKKKIALLKSEGVIVKKGRIVDFKKKFFVPR